MPSSLRLSETEITSVFATPKTATRRAMASWMYERLKNWSRMREMTFLNSLLVMMKSLLVFPARRWRIAAATCLWSTPFSSMMSRVSIPSSFQRLT